MLPPSQTWISGQKNFKYCSLDIRELVRRCSQTQQEEYFTSPSELYYLRSLSTAGSDPRSTPPVSLRTEFPEISDDFTIPPLFDASRLFSSVLRVSSGGVRVWTHYDVMNNVYCQIIGHKRAVLWDPREALNLYLDGDKSTVIDIDNPDETQFPLFVEATKYVADLKEIDSAICYLYLSKTSSYGFGVGGTLALWNYSWCSQFVFFLKVWGALN